MAKTELWEDTIVLALRDMQWRMFVAASERERAVGAPRPAVPTGMMKLDGRAEAKLGDVVAALPGAKFYLFEVKAGAAKVRDEWRKGKKAGGKLAYSTLTGIVNDANQEHRTFQSETAQEKGLDSPSEIDPLDYNTRPKNDCLRYSLRGHHLVYWSAVEDKGVIIGDIVFEPYVLGAALGRNEEDLDNPDLLQSLDWDYRLVVRGASTRTLPLKRLSSAEVWSRRPASGDDTFQHKLSLGLSGDEFERYVEFLCERVGDRIDSGGHEAIHAVVLSSSGGFMRILRSTRDLVALLRGDPALAAGHRLSPSSKFR